MEDLRKFLTDAEKMALAETASTFREWLRSSRKSSTQTQETKPNGQ